MYKENGLLVKLKEKSKSVVLFETVLISINTYEVCLLCKNRLRDLNVKLATDLQIRFDELHFS